MNFYFTYKGGSHDETVPALYIKCKYCNEDVGYMLIEKGGVDAQTDLMRMATDYKVKGVCLRCTRDHLNITKDPDLDRRFANVESQRIIRDGDQ